jgi:hypothetical protein
VTVAPAAAAVGLPVLLALARVRPASAVPFSGVALCFRPGVVAAAADFGVPDFAAVDLLRGVTALALRSLAEGLSCCCFACCFSLGLARILGDAAATRVFAGLLVLPALTILGLGSARPLQEPCTEL